MKNIILGTWLISLSFLYARDQNLIILVDNLHQETIHNSDITATHQLITALQQKAAIVLATPSLWKNIIDRKKHFEHRLKDRLSCESQLYDMYQKINTRLKKDHENLDTINKEYSNSWYTKNYPELSKLSSSDMDRLKFNFLCYNFVFVMNEWKVFDTQHGMLLFVPCNKLIITKHLSKITDQRDFIKHGDKKAHVVKSLQSFMQNNHDQWVMYLSGHGHPKNHQQTAYIAGMSIKEFEQMVSFFNENVTVKLLLYNSCYGGGVHTVEPYKNMRLHFPTIVIGITDAPTYGFGLFEGVKLPPYDEKFTLHASDIDSEIGLLPSMSQHFDLFFKHAWNNKIDHDVVASVSQFFTCDSQICYVHKVENLPLIRQAGDVFFMPLQNFDTRNLTQVITLNRSIVARKPLLLYVKKIKKIEMPTLVPIVSMLPGLQSHQIEQLVADKLPLSKIVNEVFFSLPDAQGYKNYLIDSLTCHNDFVKSKKSDEKLTHVMILQHGLKPKFVHQKEVQACICFQSGNQKYLVIWNNQKAVRVMKLTEEQCKIMEEIEIFMHQEIDYQADISPKKLVEFDQYAKNKQHQHAVIASCLHQKICKQW